MKAEDLDKLGLISKELERKDNLARLGTLARQQPGTRQDGSVLPLGLSEKNQQRAAELNVVDQVRNALTDWHRIIDGLEGNIIQLESKIGQLNAQLDTERDARQSLEKMISEISNLVKPQ